MVAEVRRPRAAWALLVLATGTFAVGTAELVVAGILPALARGMDVSIGAAGQLVTVYALVFALSGPALTLLAGRVERRALLIGTLLLFVAGSLLAAAAPTYGVLMGTRFVSATASAVFTASATAVAVDLVPPERRGQALGVIFVGFSSAAVLGVPLGTILGVLVGWRTTFAAVAALACAAAVFVALAVPRSPTRSGRTSASAPARLVPLLRPRVLLTLAASLLLMTGQYTLYTYVAVFLARVTGLGGVGVSGVLLAFGLAGVAGAAGGGRLADRVGTVPTLIGSAGALAAVLFLMPSTASTTAGAASAAAAWGLVSWAFSTAVQHRLISLAPGAPDVVSALNLSAFNLGIAGGSAVGGRVLSAATAADLASVGGALVVLAIVSVALSVAPEVRRDEGVDHGA